MDEMIEREPASGLNLRQKITTGFYVGLLSVMVAASHFCSAERIRHVKTGYASRVQKTLTETGNALVRLQASPLKGTVAENRTSYILIDGRVISTIPDLNTKSGESGIRERFAKVKEQISDIIKSERSLPEIVIRTAGEFGHLDVILEKPRSLEEKAYGWVSGVNRVTNKVASYQFFKKAEPPAEAEKSDVYPAEIKPKPINRFYVSTNGDNLAVLKK